MPHAVVDSAFSQCDLRPIIDEEIDHLPEKYRAPIVMCYLQGKTNDETAAALGWTRGTVAGRLSRARDMLRERLATAGRHPVRRGIGRRAHPGSNGRRLV